MYIVEFNVVKYTATPLNVIGCNNQHLFTNSNSADSILRNIIIGHIKLIRLWSNELCLGDATNSNTEFN